MKITTTNEVLNAQKIEVKRYNGNTFNNIILENGEVKTVPIDQIKTIEDSNNIITEEMVIFALNDFSKEYSTLGLTIKNIPVQKWIEEIKNGTQEGNWFKDKVIKISLLTLWNSFGNKEIMKD